MSRDTQFIGLTRAAEDFVKDLKELPSDSHAIGMFDEEIPLRRWEMHPVFERWDRPSACIREIVQCQPWSSGPMIFTCLDLDWGNGASSGCFEWVSDPTLSVEFCQKRQDEEFGGNGMVTVTVGGEYDRERGTMWV
jgi:hypothetical protein